jgi:hypothetical protein
MAVKFIDHSIEVKAALNDATIKKLHEAANAVKSHAQRNCTMRSEDSGRLAESYRADVDESAGKAQIGTPMEEGFWEEFGTGTHADTKKNGGKRGREGWWIYTPDSEGPEGYKSNVYPTKEDAEIMAAYIRAKYKHDAVVTNGRKPSYTLEKAFIANESKIQKLFADELKETFGT